MKSKILFVMTELKSGGAQKSLISLLSNLDYNRFDVDLFLFKHEGVFLDSVPKEVNLLEPQRKWQIFSQTLFRSVLLLLKQRDFILAYRRTVVALMARIKRFKSPSHSTQVMWRYLSYGFDTIGTTYDISIGYLETQATYFAIEKTNARVKYGWFHNDYQSMGLEKRIDLHYFEQLNRVITVSSTCKESLEACFPELSKNICIIENLIPKEYIQSMSLRGTGFNDSFTGFRLLTVGRLTTQKGYDLAIEACRTLIQHGYDIRWYAIGDGELKKSILDDIERNNLQQRFILLGVHKNPYTYIRQCDLYVQTSLWEGKSIAIEEAKVLCKPIIATNFPTVSDQIENRKNGLVVGTSSWEIFKGISEVIDNPSFRESLIKNLMDETNQDFRAIDRFSQIVNEDLLT